MLKLVFDKGVHGLGSVGFRGKIDPTQYQIGWIGLGGWVSFLWKKKNKT